MWLFKIKDEIQESEMEKVSCPVYFQMSEATRILCYSLRHESIVTQIFPY